MKNRLFGVLALIVCMFFEFAGHALGVYASGHEVVVHVTQHAHNLCCQGFIQDFNCLCYVAFVTLGYGAVFHLVYGTLSDFLDISNKMWHKVLVRGDCCQ